MHEYIVIDVETTIFCKGNPFSRRNECCYIGFGDARHQEVLEGPFSRQDLDRLRTAIQRAKVIVAFNAKFDFHWLERLGVTEWKDKTIWDLQIAEFVMSGQRHVMPSLEQSLTRFTLPKKLDIVRLEYWEKGIDTPNIPRDLMVSYTTQDVLSESLLYERQLTALDGQWKMLRLVKLCNKDLLTIQEMEYNGSKFNTVKALEDAKRLDRERLSIRDGLRRRFGVPRLNPGSSDHISACLFGGTVVSKWKHPYLRIRKGEEIIGFKHFEERHHKERIIEPLKQYKLDKAGMYSASADHLRSLRPNREVKGILQQLARYAELDKLIGTYLTKLPKLIEEMDWPEDRIHGQFNQCVVVTGRLSSSKPNRQNEPPDVKFYFESEFPNEIAENNR